VVARLFRLEHKPKFPENWRVDPHSGCSCSHPHHPKYVGDHLAPHFFIEQEAPDKLPLRTKESHSRDDDHIQSEEQVGNRVNCAVHYYQGGNAGQPIQNPLGI
jgi:hypothetical protein